MQPAAAEETDPVALSPDRTGVSRLARGLLLLLGGMLAAGTAHAVAAPRNESLLTRPAQLEVLFADVDRGLVDTVYQDGGYVVWRPAGAVTWSSAEIRGVTNALKPVDDMRDVLAEAAAVNPGVELEVASEGSWWQGFAVVGGLGGFGTFLLLIGGPAPRRANRWAWFWMLYVGNAYNLGALAFLLLGARGRRGDLGRHREPDRRLNGAQGFLVAVLAAVVLSVLSALLRHYVLPGRGPSRDYDYGALRAIAS